MRLTGSIMPSLLAVAGAAAASSPSSGAAGPPHAFANTFGNSMVLQRNAPLALWGTGDCSGGCTIALQQGPSCTSKLCNASVSASTTDPSSFNGTLPAMPASGSGWMPAEPMTISLYSGSSFNSESTPLATLADVLVGDVVLVSGQSNVGISVNYSNQFNWTAQLENQAEADRVGARLRLMAVGQGMMPTEQTQLTHEVPCKLPSAQCGCLRWARANATNIVGYSALGWYLGRALYAAQHETVPIGIIQSDVPGTPIQKWMPNATLDECYAGPRDPEGPTAVDSHLYNSMIHPFVHAKQGVSAVVWYQGESNVGPNDHVNDTHGPENGAEYYRCALPAMVRAWRARLPKRPVGPDASGTKASLPFFVVELAAYCNQNDENTFMVFCDSNTTTLAAADYHLPEMRIAQASVLANDSAAYLASAMDLGALHPLPYASIHPTNKLALAQRVALAMRHSLYEEAVVYSGPRPLHAVVAAHASRASGDTASPTASIVQVHFETQNGAGGLSLDTTAVCPTVVLDVYCRRAQKLGFEVQIGGVWQAPQSVALVSPQVVELVLSPASFSNVTAVARVRYAYSDWPVVSLRNKVDGLPARIFDIEVTSASNGVGGQMATTSDDDNSVRSVVPTLDELAGDWVQAEDEVDMPQISAFTNSVGTNADDLFSINSFLNAPFLQGVSLCNMTVDDVQLRPERHQWRAYQATRQATAADGLIVTVDTRLAFSAPGVLWNVHLSSQTSGRHKIELQLTPMIRQATALPWVPAYPNTTSNFDFKLVPTDSSRANESGSSYFLHTMDNMSAAESSFGFISGELCDNPNWSVSRAGGKVSILVNVQAGRNQTLQFAMLAGNATWPAAGEGKAGVLEAFREMAEPSEWSKAWEQTALLWEERWQQAFTPNNAHFSGHLPSLSSPSAALTRIYYNSLLTAVSLERTNLPLVAERVYLTAAGNALPYNCATCFPHIDGMLEVGAAASYYWDVKQMATVMSLLDPVAFKSYLTFVLQLPSVDGKAGFESSNGVDLFTGSLFGAWYAFNSEALFTSLYTYLATTGDRAFATTVIGGKRVSDWMAALATHWKQFALTSAHPPEPWLADYGGFAGDFLECVPDYMHTVPALQAANAWMLRRTAELWENGWVPQHLPATGGNASSTRASPSVAQLRSEAAAIVNATIARLWVANGNGVWGCLNGSNSVLTAVRSIVDFQAIGNLLTDEDGAAAGGVLPLDVKREMSDFFVRELSNCASCDSDDELGSKGTDWPIALSRSDDLRFIDRPDHGTTGAYASWPPMAAQSLAELDGDFRRATPFFLGTASAARLGPYGQANAVQIVTTPGHGPHDIDDPHGPFGVKAFKTTRGADRYTALAGGAWAEIILHSFFGWRPSLYSTNELWRGSVKRGVTGKLLWLRTPQGTRNITLGKNAGPHWGN